MNPFEAARLEASKLRQELESKGIDLNQGGFALVTAACKALDIALKQVKPETALLKSADATILVERKWTLVRKDVSDEIKAFLVAHEIGHLRLHPTTPGSVEVSQSALTGETESNGVSLVESYGARERQELQANVFAREFLLPRSEARRAFLFDSANASGLAEDRKLPLELVRLQLYDGILLPTVEKASKVFKLPDKPTVAQQPAVDSDAPVSLIEAGPGTGKTTTLLLRLRRLIAKGVNPENIIILTFSNKAARELVERARAGKIPGADRVWIGTFHAFGLEFLRKFGHLCGLEPRLPVLDKLATLAMLEQDVPSVDLLFHDPLSNPSPWLEGIVDAIRRSKDEVMDAAGFEKAVDAEPAADSDTTKKLQDALTIFKRYELLLKVRKAVDLTDLMCVPIRLMEQDDPAVRRFLQGIQHLMVDEYQDVNRASAQLVRQLSKNAQTTWVVGDANQAIYAFMGASSSNLSKFQEDFPGAKSIPLVLNHRSSEEIVVAFGAVASANPAGRPTVTLTSEMGPLQHGPKLVRHNGLTERARALAWRIRDLESKGTPLAEQAVITFLNGDAGEIAAGLEALDIPVLYLGNILERAEVKDLICLLQLAVDAHGSNLVRSWHARCLTLSREGADHLLAQAREKDADWKKVSGTSLSANDFASWQNLVRICSELEENTAPWDALSSILLEDGTLLRELAARDGQAAANSLMAIWQFVHFCRTPDGTGRWSTIKNIPQRIRDRIRLSEIGTLRHVPPEAEGMNAVRILTGHGSKGLEFDAVHFIDVTERIYQPTKTQAPNKHIPRAVLDSAAALAILKNERHNLLYVAVSRPRKYLTVFAPLDEELPTALNGLLEALDGPWERSIVGAPTAEVSPVPMEISLEEYIQYKKCPQQSEMSSRAGPSPREELKTHRAVELAARRAMRTLMANPTKLSEVEGKSAVDEALAHFGLVDEGPVDLIRQRVQSKIDVGRKWLAEGGTGAPATSMTLGPLKVGLEPDQVLNVGGKRILRFIRTSESSITSMKQPLAALLHAHHEAGGEKTDIQIAVLTDERPVSVGRVIGNTPAKYREMAADLCAKRFPAAPEGYRTCHYCPHMFPCSREVSEE